MPQKWYQKATVQAAIVGGLFLTVTTILGAVLGWFNPLSLSRHTTDDAPAAKVPRENTRDKSRYVQDSVTKRPPNQDTSSPPTTQPSVDHKSGDARSPKQPQKREPSPPAMEYIREKTAGQIIKNLEGTRWERGKKIKDLYLNRWVREPGWSGKVIGLPSHQDTANTWSLVIREEGTNTPVGVFSADPAVANLRNGDRITVQGRVISIGTGTVYLADATITTD